jgi:hypothetical protein
MKVLVIAPHPDDEVLGAGGTIARLAIEGNDVIRRSSRFVLKLALPMRSWA